jgi:hypothetical protein
MGLFPKIQCDITLVITPFLWNLLCLHAYSIPFYDFFILAYPERYSRFYDTPLLFMSTHICIFYPLGFFLVFFSKSKIEHKKKLCYMIQKSAWLKCFDFWCINSMKYIMIWRYLDWIELKTIQNVPFNRTFISFDRTL